MTPQTDYLQAEFESLLPPPLPVNRRGFLVTALGAGFALAVQPVMAQTAIVTDSEGLTAGEIQVPAAGGNMPAYRAQPAQGANFPVILVVQEIFGVHEHIKDVCRRLAKLGYQAIAPELYARQGDPRQYTAIPDILAKVVSKVPDSQVMADLDACVAWARANGGDTKRLGVTGFCWGGRITWLYAAHNPKLKAGIAWYGRVAGTPSALTPRHPLDLVAEIKAPMLGLYGAKDQGIPVSDVEDMRDDLAKAGRQAEFVIYPEAGHAFHADYRPSYRAAEAADGWARLLAWLGKCGM